MQRDRIERRVDAAAREQRRQGRGEADEATAFGVIERLDAETVARQHDAAGIALPQRKGEHALEALHAIRAPGVIRFQDDFGVAVGEEAITLALQLRAQLAEIIDAAVESDSEPKLVVGHRLLRGGCQIKDAETPVAERLPALR